MTNVPIPKRQWHRVPSQVFLGSSVCVHVSHYRKGREQVRTLNVPLSANKRINEDVPGVVIVVRCG